MDATSQPAPTPTNTQVHWPSVWQLVFSALAIFNLWIGAALMVVSGFVDILINATSVGDTLPIFMMAAATAFTGLLLLPSAGYALLRIMGRERREPLPFFQKLRPTLLIFIFPLVLLLGYWVVGFPALAWLLLPLLHVLAIGIPVLWLLSIAVHGLPLGAPQRMWGVFGTGLALSPVLIMIVEFAALMVFVFIGAMIIASQPELVQELEYLLDWLVNAGPTPEMVLERLAPRLMQPQFILLVLVFGAVIVPLIEEIFKPIGLWFLMGQDLTPAAGFAAGALSGAGYAFFESLLLSSSGDDWAVLVIARIGTAVIHIVTTALTGWALAMAWRTGRYGLLGISFLGAVLIHSLWNGLTLLYAITSLPTDLGVTLELHPLIFRLGEVGPYLLAALALFCFAAMLWANRRLARTSPGTKQPGQTLTNQEEPESSQNVL